MSPTTNARCCGPRSTRPSSTGCMGRTKWPATATARACRCASMLLELKGFAPDADPTTPGVLTDCDAIVPTTAGLAGANLLVASELPARAGDSTSRVCAEVLDGAKLHFVPTLAGPH